MTLMTLINHVPLFEKVYTVFFLNLNFSTWLDARFLPVKLQESLPLLLQFLNSDNPRLFLCQRVCKKE